MDRTQGGTSAILPFDVDELLVKPVYEQSVALNVFTTTETTRESVHIPIVEEGVTAEFLNELETYGTDDITMDELFIRPRKLGKSVPGSVELVDDSDPAFADIIGADLTRAISEGLDKSVFGNQAETTKVFAGIDNKTAYNFLTLDAGNGTEWDVDSFIDAQAIVEGNNYVLGSYVMNSADLVKLRKVKEGEGSKRGLFDSDPNLPSRIQIGGVPIVLCNFVPVNTIWAVSADAGRMVVRSDSQVEIDRSTGFLNDAVWFKGTMRVGFGIRDTRGIVRLTNTA